MPQGNDQRPALVYADTPRGLFWVLQIAVTTAFVALTGLNVIFNTDLLLRLIGLVACGAMLLFFLPLAVILQRRSMRQLALSPEGIHVGSASQMFVPWAAIVRVDVRRFYGSATAQFELMDVRMIRSQNGLARLFTTGSKLVLRGADGTRTREFGAAADYYLAHPEERALVGIQPPQGLERPSITEHTRVYQIARVVFWIGWLLLAPLFLTLLSLLLIARASGTA